MTTTYLFAASGTYRYDPDLRAWVRIDS